MTLKRRRKRLVSDINVVPYIDVMLVLLVIFMITAPLLTQGVQVSLPKAQANVIDANSQEPFIVSVDKHGRYYFNAADDPAKPMLAEELAIVVAAHRHLESDRPVLVNGDTDVTYGKIVTAMALLQKSGVESVGLLTESPEPTH